MYEAAASCEDIAWTLVTNWEPQYVMLAGYGYAVRHMIKIQLITPYCVSRNVTVLRYTVTLQVWTHP
jgi:predicted PurR-regulated permease PerM